ncbi:hypothetical protein GCM10023231_11820 [Olivibacter ginsenosidimutans]|uniref:O-antigen ligase-related domain-containing protein n=1 Tax=Olivibacter ginsenosidimutans TaxID=1176537 RepID=A0ABP9AUM8_9SPHI
MLSIAFLLIFLIVSIVLLYRIQLGFALVVACRLLVPGIVRISLGVVELSLNSSLTLMLYGVLVLNLLLRRPYEVKIFSKFYKPFFVLLGGHFLLAFFGSDMGVSVQMSSLIQLFYTEFSLCFIGWIIYQTEKDVRQFYKIIGITTFFITLYGVICYITLSNPYILLINAIYDPTREGVRFMEEARAGLAGRVQGTATHPLTWGGINLLLFFFFFNYKVFKWRIVNISLLGLLFLNVFFSGSRSALLALILGIAYIVLFSNVKIKTRFITYGFGIFATVVVLLYQVPALSKYQDFFESTLFFWDDSQKSNDDIKGSSASGRLEQLEGSFDMIEKSPLTGLGQGFIKDYSTTFGVHPILKGFESILFMALVETGILGLTLWAFFFFMCFQFIKYAQARLQVYDDMNYIVLRGGLIGYVLFTVFTGIQLTLYLFLILYIMQLKRCMIYEKFQSPLFQLSKTDNFLRSKRMLFN